MTEREIQEGPCIHCITPYDCISQVWVTSQAPGPPSWSSTWWQGLKDLGHPWCPQVHEQGAGTEAEQFGLELVLR